MQECNAHTQTIHHYHLHLGGYVHYIYKLIKQISIVISVSILAVESESIPSTSDNVKCNDCDGKRGKLPNISFILKIPRP